MVRRLRNAKSAKGKRPAASLQLPMKQNSHAPYLNVIGPPGVTVQEVSNVIKQSDACGEDEERLSTRLEAVKNAPDGLWFIGNPVQNAEAHDFVELSPPIRTVASRLGVPDAVGYIGCRVVLTCTGEHLL